MLGVLGAVALTVRANTIQIGTGLDSTGNLLGSGSSEQNYTVAGVDTSAIAYVETQYPGAWVGNLANGQWISPVNPETGQPSQQIGLFSYTRTIYGIGSMSGEFSSDNGGALYVNGTLVAQTAGWPDTITGDYQFFTQFNNIVLNQSVNTIEFVVYNALYTPDTEIPNPTGLIVAGTATVPDGGMTVILLGGALAGMQALRRKLRR